MMFDFHRTPTYQVIEAGEEFGKITTMSHDVVAGGQQKELPGLWLSQLIKKVKLISFQLMDQITGMKFKSQSYYF